MPIDGIGVANIRSMANGRSSTNVGAWNTRAFVARDI